MYRRWGHNGRFTGLHDFGPDRSNWNDKSVAALQRETQAKRLFDAFLEKSKVSPSFPVTEEVVPAHLYLTQACWKSFKNYVEATGCTLKRREATQEERMKTHETRKSKLWVISVTVPVHPDRTIQFLKDKLEKAEASAEMKKQKQKAKEEKRRAEEAHNVAEELALQTKIKREYQCVLDSLKANTKIGVSMGNNETCGKNNTGFPSKKRKTTPIFITVPRSRMLDHAEQMHQVRVREIIAEIREEVQVEHAKLLTDLTARIKVKKDTLIKEARDYRDQVKDSIGSFTAEHGQN